MKLFASGFSRAVRSAICLFPLRFLAAGSRLLPSPVILQRAQVTNPSTGIDEMVRKAVRRQILQPETFSKRHVFESIPDNGLREKNPHLFTFLRPGILYLAVKDIMNTYQTDVRGSRATMPPRRRRRRSAVF
ncbi:MAG: hypothetical protein IJQ02_05250, partial [Oscillospiraceae bacterium]|nr:hypothetical protein [Oscillospiraceae bacterium]